MSNNNNNYYYYYYNYYSGRETPSLKMGSVCCCCCCFSYYFLGGRLLVLCWLVGASPICHQCHLANMIWRRSCSQPDKCDRKSHSKTFARAQSSVVPLKELSRVILTREPISKNIPKSSKIHNYTRREHVLRDLRNAFGERTCKHEMVQSSFASTERSTNRKITRSNRKTSCIQRSQS